MSHGKRLVTRVQWIVVALWTALNLAAYALVNFVGDLLIRHSDRMTGDADTVVFIYQSFSALQGLGFGLIVASWAIGTLVILGIAWLIRRALD